MSRYEALRATSLPTLLAAVWLAVAIGPASVARMAPPPRGPAAPGPLPSGHHLSSGSPVPVGHHLSGTASAGTSLSFWLSSALPAATRLHRPKRKTAVTGAFGVGMPAMPLTGPPANAPCATRSLLWKVSPIWRVSKGTVRVRTRSQRKQSPCGGASATSWNSPGR